jgi:hypothetical protein
MMRARRWWPAAVGLVLGLVMALATWHHPNTAAGDAYWRARGLLGPTEHVYRNNPATILVGAVAGLGLGVVVSLVLSGPQGRSGGC